MCWKFDWNLIFIRCDSYLHSYSVPPSTKVVRALNRSIPCTTGVVAPSLHWSEPHWIFLWENFRDERRNLLQIEFFSSSYDEREKCKKFLWQNYFEKNLRFIFMDRWIFLKLMRKFAFYSERFLSIFFPIRSNNFKNQFPNTHSGSHLI